MGSEASGRKLDRAADLAAKRSSQSGFAFEHRDHCWVSDEPLAHLAFKRGTAKQCASFGRGAIPPDFEQ